MDARTIQTTLNANGFPCGAVDGIIGPHTRAAVVRFQQAFAGAGGLAPLDADGVPGPLTQAALEQLPHLSPNFVVAELRSHGNGDCFVRRELVDALERYRDLAGPGTPLSAYRDPAHNQAVGGAPDSMHLYGFAADPWGNVSVADVEALGIFSGIGDKAGAVRHVDLRHLSEHNHTPGATPSSPARWQY